MSDDDAARVSPLEGRRPLDEREERFWCEVYTAFVSAPLDVQRAYATGGVAAPGLFADGAVVELRERTGRK